MKLGVWALILAVTLWSLDRDRWITEAMAGVNLIPTATVTRTQTAANGSVSTMTEVLFRTETTTSIDGPSTSTSTNATTDTNCHTGGGQYGGGQWNYCNRTDPNQQRNTQDDTNNLNNNGANQSTALGLAAIAAGMAMVAAGVALLPNPPTTPAGIALIAAGMAMIASGMAALAAAKNMNNNANKAGDNALRHDNLTDKYKSTISDGTGKSGSLNSALGDANKIKLGDGNSSGIKIDPALLRTGKMDSIFSDLERKTGMNRDDFLKDMKNGANPLDMLANSPGLKGRPGGSEANLQKAFDDALARGNTMNGQEVMDKLGLTSQDLGANNTIGDGGGAGTNRSVANNSGASLESLFPAKDQPAAPTTPSLSELKASADVQKALDKNGITSRTIFEMVHSQYVRKTPQLFGVELKKDGTSNNPFSNLLMEKVDL